MSGISVKWILAAVITLLVYNPAQSEWQRFQHMHTQTIICTWDITLDPNKGVCFFV